MKTASLVFPMLAVGLLLLPTCSNDKNPGPPPDGVLNLYGTVRGPNGPEDNVQIRVEEINSGLIMTIPTDDRGNYILTLPAGRYRLLASPSRSTAIWYAPGGLTYRSSQAGTIVVTGNPGDMRIDFLLAGLRLSIRTPPGLSGSDVECNAIDPVTKTIVGGATSSVADSALIFDFGTLLPGSYLLNFSTYRQQCWYPHTLEYRRAEPIEVRALERAVRVDTLGMPGHVTGRVQGAWLQSTYYNFEVALFSPDSVIISSEYIETDGRFDLPVLAEGEVRMRLRGLGTEIWMGGGSFSDAEPIRIIAGSVADVGTVQTHGITCRLVVPPGLDTSYWLPTLVGRAGPVAVRTVETTSEGLWLLPLGEAGVYALHVRWVGPSEWRPQWFDRATSMDDATLISVDDAVAPTSIDIQLERGGTISGRVLDGTGAPVVDARLAIRLGTDLIRVWRTGTDGGFRIGGLPDGPVRFAVLFEGTYIWYPGTDSEEQAETIEILNAGDNPGLDLFLPAGGSTDFRYIGGTACKPCHTGEAKGRIWETWLATAHAGAYADLSTAQRDSAACLACHTTGFLGAVAAGRDRSDLLGVQCEACHGPGSEYRSLAVMKDPVEAAEKGLVVPNASVCVPCHSSDLPRECWGVEQQAPIFDYDQARALIAHSRPGMATGSSKSRQGR